MRVIGGQPRLRLPGSLALLVASVLATLISLNLTPIDLHATAAHAADDTEQHQQHELNERLQQNGDFGSEDMGDRIPPMLWDDSQTLDPFQLAPIDPSVIEITTVTPADRFIRATTPLLAALSMGALGMLVLAISQAVRKRSVGEIRLGE